jgi:hypothetical protein
MISLTGTLAAGSGSVRGQYRVLRSSSGVAKPPSAFPYPTAAPKATVPLITCGISTIAGA